MPIRSIAARVCLLVLMGLMTPRALAHPQDGAHADIRVQITDTGVRLDVVINLVFIDAIGPTGRENTQALHEIEEPMVRELLARFFADQNRVTIDGIVAVPTITAFSVVRPGEALLPLFPRTGMRGAIRARLIVDYDVEEPPREVGFVWSVFPPDMTSDIEPMPPISIEAQLTAEGKVTILRFTRDEPEVVWHSSGTTARNRFLEVPQGESAAATIRLPMISLGLGGVLVVLLGWVGVTRSWSQRRGLVAVAMPLLVIGALVTLGVGGIEVADPRGRGGGLPDDAEALAIFGPLHANIYRAFDSTDRNAIYDALARSVDGELLDELFSQIYGSLILYEAGGAVSRVQAVTPIETTVTSIGRVGEDASVGFTVDARWRVKGMVYHWGHSHTRVNEYRAAYTVVNGAQGWRIASNRIIEQFRVELSSTDPTEQEAQPDTTMRVGEL